MPRLTSALIYLMGAIIPVAVVGVLFNFMTMSQVMVRKNPPVLDLAKTPIEAAPRVAEKSSKKLKAAVLVSNLGTEVTDLFGPYEILSRSGLFDLYTVAPERKLSMTTGNVSILPDHDFASAPKPDVLIVPAVLDPDNAALIDWVRRNAPSARLVAGFCEGARILAAAGVLGTREATSHFLALEDLQINRSEVKWIHDRRVVEERGVITSAGITGSLDGAFAVIQNIGGSELASRVASEMGFISADPQNKVAPQSASFKELLPVMARGGFDWGKRQIGVLIYPGVSELSLAAALDTYIRTLSTGVTPVSAPLAEGASQPLIETQHGMKVFAQESISRKSWLHELIIPSGASGSQPLTPAVKTWITETQPEIEDLIGHRSGSAFDDHLRLLSQSEGAGTARFVAKMIEYPKPIPPSDAPTYPTRLWMRALLMAIFGMFVVWMARVKLEARSNPADRPTR